MDLLLIKFHKNTFFLAFLYNFLCILKIYILIGISSGFLPLWLYIIFYKNFNKSLTFRSFSFILIVGKKPDTIYEKGDKKNET